MAGNSIQYIYDVLQGYKFAIWDKIIFNIDKDKKSITLTHRETDNTASVFIITTIPNELIILKFVQEYKSYRRPKWYERWFFAEKYFPSKYFDLSIELDNSYICKRNGSEKIIRFNGNRYHLCRI